MFTLAEQTFMASDFDTFVFNSRRRYGHGVIGQAGMSKRHFPAKNPGYRSSSCPTIKQGAMRYTQTTLKKIEELFGELDYTIRYEKGNFQSGYCLVEQRRVAVVNRFFDTEARINCLLDILSKMAFDVDSLSEKSRDLIEKWKKQQEES